MPTRKKTKLSPKSETARKIRQLKERRRNESPEARNIRLAEQRFRVAVNRALETPAERSARLEACRVRMASIRKTRLNRPKEAICLYERLKSLVANSELSLDLIQQLDENFVEEAPENGVESRIQKKERLVRNGLRRALKKNKIEQEIQRVKSEKLRIKKRQQRSLRSEDARALLLKYQTLEVGVEMEINYNKSEVVKVEATIVED